jgi:hypothetical protein
VERFLREITDAVLGHLQTHQDWTQAFLAAPTVLGVIDIYGIESEGPPALPL